ncbi:MAG: hypothetical protein JW904_10835 [Spirochaetales bacterium]|nr:hypothetical protein [Spirochaetales bacterium]
MTKKQSIWYNEKNGRGCRGKAVRFFNMTPLPVFVFTFFNVIISFYINSPLPAAMTTTGTIRQQ